MKRTPMRKKSSKQRAVEKELAPLRKRWRQHVRTCMVCDNRMATEVHEIVAGAGRHLSYENPLTWIACCNPCHAEIQGKPYETQANIVAAAVRRAINRCAIRDAI